MFVVVHHPDIAAVNALGGNVRVVDYHEHALGSGSAVEAVCYIEMQIDDRPAIFGVGIDRSIVSAAIKALFNGLNRHCTSPTAEAVESEAAVASA